MYGAYGVVSALFARQRTGRGQVVRTSLLAAGMGVHAFHGTRWTVAQEVSQAGGNHHPSIAPYGLFQCQDGAVQLAVGSESLWQRFCVTLGLDPQAEGFVTNRERVVNVVKLIDLLEEIFAKYDSVDLLAKLDDAGIPAGLVRSIDEVYESEQAHSQGLKIEVEHQTLGTLTLPGPPLRFFATDGTEVTRRTHAAPPVLGADRARVVAWLSSTPEA